MKHKPTLDCKVCGETVEHVGEDAVKVTCSLCVSKMMRENISFESEENYEKELTP